MKWNGTSWSDVVNSSTDANSDNLLLASSSVQQVLVAPASSGFAESGYFSTNDRLLMVTGQLNLANTGSASSALFDGSSWYPYLLSTTAGGAAGTVAGLFYPAAAITFGNREYYSACRWVSSDQLTCYLSRSSRCWPCHSHLYGYRSRCRVFGSSRCSHYRSQ
jgi:hypothetical protein